ncbi:RidA family protein [Roseomonas sp. AR75]|jgi:enamine deaminase RidA (YjgF/YER057c/UK114 family)|uniref:RidA family protein n=1 Tax=Roseomonas sp. AR75 TaxID=2562311 RepID=UPI0010C10D40|nr:RidA family protein [Roseomonas sp. AR75]
MSQDSARPEPLLPVPFPGTRARFARGMRAGDWVFATGLAGTDYANGLAPEVVQADHPLDGEPKAMRESRRLFANAAEILAAGGCGFPDVVRIDQYYTRPEAVDPYHAVRRETFAGRIPPSTSNLHQRFARTGQELEVQVMAAVPRDGRRAEHLAFRPSYDIHHTSGYSPGLAYGDFRFIPGQTAEARVHGEGPLDPEARRPQGLWKGTPIQLETDFIVRRKLAPSLEAAGASLDSVVKAQVYLRDRDDVPAFNQAWQAHFRTPPATTIVATSTPGFIMPDSRIEINTIALATDGTTRKEVVAGGVAPLFRGYPPAVRAGDLLLLSGMMAMRGGTLVPAARVDPRQPFFAMPVKAELAAILEDAEAICRATGTSIANVVRMQMFLSDLADLPACIETAHDALEGRPLPLSAIEVPWLPAPGARVLLDLWVHAR